MKAIRLKDPVYQADLFLLAGSLDDLRAWAHRRDPTGDARNAIGSRLSQGKCLTHIWSNGSREWWIWFPTSTPASCHVLHEVLHVTFYVLRDRGLELTDASDEAFTYYAEMLFNQVNAALARGKRQKR